MNRTESIALADIKLQMHNVDQTDTVDDFLAIFPKLIQLSLRLVSSRDPELPKCLNQQESVRGSPQKIKPALQSNWALPPGRTQPALPVT